MIINLRPFLAKMTDGEQLIALGTLVVIVIWLKAQLTPTPKGNGKVKLAQSDSQSSLSAANGEVIAAADEELWAEVSRLMRNTSEAASIVRQFGGFVEAWGTPFCPLNDSVLPRPKLQIKAGLCVGTILAESEDAVHGCVLLLAALTDYQPRSGEVLPQRELLAEMTGVANANDPRASTALAGRIAVLRENGSRAESKRELLDNSSLVDALLKARAEARMKSQTRSE